MCPTYTGPCKPGLCFSSQETAVFEFKRRPTIDNTDNCGSLLLQQKNVTVKLTSSN